MAHYAGTALIRVANESNDSRRAIQDPPDARRYAIDRPEPSQACLPGQLLDPSGGYLGRWVVGAQYPLPGGQHVPQLGLSRGVIPPRGHLHGDLVPGGQRARMVHPQTTEGLRSSGTSRTPDILHGPA